MKSLAVTVLPALMFLVCSCAGWGQPTTPTDCLTLANVSPYTYLIGGFFPLPPSGISVNILFDPTYVDHQQTTKPDLILELDAGAGWQLNYFYRNPDGSPYSGSSVAPTTFDQEEFWTDIGARLGIAKNKSETGNLLELFAFYRLHFDRNFQTPGTPVPLVFQSAFPDRVEIMSNAALFGADYNCLEKRGSGPAQDGLYVEASLEYGPRGPFNGDGEVDYYRLNATAEAFRTICGLSSEGPSLYLADYASVDYAGGSSIPIYVFESIGGRYPRTSEASTVRGFETGSYGADFKALNNFEIRASCQCGDFVPGCYGFFDSEYYNGYFEDPSNTPAGCLLSAGGGIFAGVAQFVTLTLYVAFPLVGQTISGETAVLGGGFGLLF